MILDGLSLGFFWFTFLLDSPVSLYNMSSASLPTVIPNDMKPGKEGENVFFFLYCEKQEITHELKSTRHEKRRIAAEFQLAKQLPGGSQICVSLTQRKAPLLLQLLPTPWEICFFSLENQAILLNMFFRLSWSHSPAFLAITGLQSHFCFLISCTVLKPYDTVWNTGF